MNAHRIVRRVSIGPALIIGHCFLVSLILGSAAFALSRQGSSRPRIDPSEEAAGFGRVVSTLISAFDDVDVVALDDTHQRKVDSDLRIRLIRAPEFAQKVHLIVVEFANTADQPTLDDYINGDDVPLAELRQVWRNTCCPDTWDSPVYADFFAAVRDVNMGLPVDKRIRVLAGDPPAGPATTERDASAISVLRGQGLDKGGKALLIFGGGHLSYAGGAITRAMQEWRPGRTLVVFIRGGQDPGYAPFEQALGSPERPILFSVRSPPFNSFSTSFLGGGSKALVNGVWVDVAPNPGATPGQEADAWVYFGNSPNVDAYVRPIR